MATDPKTGRDTGVLGILEFPGQQVAKGVAHLPVLGQAEGVGAGLSKDATRNLKQQTGNTPATQAAQTTNTVINAGGDLAKIFGSADFWIGLGEAVLAIGFLFIGLHSLITGDSGMPGLATAAKVAKVVK